MPSNFILHCVLVIYMYLQMHQFLDPAEEEQVVQQLEEYSRNGWVYVCDRQKGLEAESIPYILGLAAVSLHNVLSSS